MFDIGFSELLVIGVVALLVIGPERMPKVARTAGHLFGRFQRYVSSVKADIGREVEFDELRRVGQSFKESVEQVAQGATASVKEAEFTMRNEVTNSADKVTQALADLEKHDLNLGDEVQKMRAEHKQSYEREQAAQQAALQELALVNDIPADLQVEPAKQGELVLNQPQTDESPILGPASVNIASKPEKPA